VLEDRLLPSLTVRTLPTPTPDGNPIGIVSYGTVAFFTEQAVNKIGQLSADGTFSTDFTVPTPNSAPFGITMGPPANSNPWFTERVGNKIGTVDALGTFHEFPVPTPGSQPYRITAGPDGALWFTELAAGQIGRAVLSPDGLMAIITEFAIPTPNSGPDGIAPGPDGNVWFTEAFAHQIGRITPAGVITEFALPSAMGDPTGIARGSDGNLWFTESAGAIGRITPAGVVTEFPVPPPPTVLGSVPTRDLQDIAADPLNLWFIDAFHGIGRVATTGVIADFSAFSGGGSGIAADANHIWFTEAANAHIGIAAVPPIVVTGPEAGGGPDVRIFDSASGQLLRQILAYDPAFTGGVRVAVGDVNGDGAPDIITAAGPGGGPHVRVWDSRTGLIITDFFAYDPMFMGGVFVAFARRIDTHFPPNSRTLVVTGAGEGGGPHVKVFDALTGQLVDSFFAYDPQFTGGVRVAATLGAGGFPDIITGAGPGGGPHVKVFSLMDMSVKQSFYAYDPAFRGGVYVAAGPMPRLALEAIVTGPGSVGGPDVRIWDEATGRLLGSFAAYDPRFLGGVRVGLAHDGDGNAFILTAPGVSGGPDVRVFSTTVARQEEWNAYDPSFEQGVYVGGA
jgi:streptogramin lyase